MQPFGRNRYGPKIGGGCAPLGEGELGGHSARTSQTGQTDRQDRTDNGPIAYGEPFYKRSPKNGSPYAIGPLSYLSVCDVRALWPNGWTDQDETWHAGRPWPWPDCVRWGPSSPPQKGHSPRQFSAHICCGQMATWIKMSLGIGLGLGPVDFVLDGDPAPPSPKGGEGGPCLLRPNGWMDEAGTWQGRIGLSPGDFVLDGYPVTFPQKGRTHSPIFGPFLYCRQTVGCIKMPLGMNVGLSSGTLC